MDYLPFFDQLSQLMTAYQKKINQLDVDITSKFMFIRTEQDKKVCLKLIQDLCVLKSPFVDQRLGIIQKWEQPRPAAFVQSIQDKDDAIPESDVKEAVEPKRVISPQELKKQRKAAAEHEINTQIGLIGQELLSDELSAETLKQCFQQILDLEFLLIQHYDEIKEKQQTFNENIDKFKSACIDVMYHAISSRNTDFMEEIYRQGHYFVDSLVIGSINEFPQTVLQEKSSRSSNERAKKLLSLFRYMFDKNDLCRVFFETSKLVTFKQNCMLTIFASMINYDEGPDYVLFLLDQGLVSPTECVGIYEQHFISLQQYILILMLTSKSLGYEALWQRFSENKSDFLTIEKKERFTLDSAPAFYE